MPLFQVDPVSKNNGAIEGAAWFRAVPVNKFVDRYDRWPLLEVMVHDFESFTGGTPTDMLRELEALFRDRIEAIRSGRRSASTADELELIL